jgi:hypothetical protein
LFSSRRAEHRLNETEVGAAFEHHCGHRVSEKMAGAVFAGIGRFDVAANDFGQVVERERFTGVGEENGFIVGLASELRTRIAGRSKISTILWLPDHEFRSNHLLQSGRIKRRKRTSAPRTEMNMHLANG